MIPSRRRNLGSSRWGLAVVALGTTAPAIGAAREARAQEASRAGEAAAPPALGPPGETAEEALAFGLWLEAQGEPYRAAGEMLRAIYLAPGKPVAGKARLALARTLHRAGLYRRAAGEYRRFLHEAPPEEQAPARLDLAWVDLRLADPEAARRDVTQALALAPPDSTTESLRRRRARFLLGLADVEQARLGSARARFEEVLAACTPGEQEAECVAAGRNRRLLDEGSPGRRRPWLAAALSAVLPGAGELYAGHPYDAASYLLLTGFFGSLAADTFDRSGGFSGQRAGFFVSAALAGSFYVANIFSAHNSAARRNAVSSNAFHRALDSQPWPPAGSVP